MPLSAKESQVLHKVNVVQQQMMLVIKEKCSRHEGLASNVMLVRDIVAAVVKDSYERTDAVNRLIKTRKNRIRVAVLAARAAKLEVEKLSPEQAKAPITQNEWLAEQIKVLDTETFGDCSLMEIKLLLGLERGIEFEFYNGFFSQRVEAIVEDVINASDYSSDSDFSEPELKLAS
jgi:hypothetical protein